MVRQVIPITSNVKLTQKSTMLTFGHGSGHVMELCSTPEYPEGECFAISL